MRELKHMFILKKLMEVGEKRFIVYMRKPTY